MRRVISFLVLAFSGCASTHDPTKDSWHQLASRATELTSTPQGIAWELKMLPIHNAFWPQVASTCSTEAKAAGVTSFKAVAVISSTGVITDYLPDSTSPYLRCFTVQMVGRKYPVPPEAPFYENYTVNLESAN